MSVCLCAARVRTYVHTYIHVCVYACVYTCLHVCTLHMCPYTHTRMNILYTYIRTYMHAYFIYVDTCIRNMYVRMYVHVCMMNFFIFS